MRMWANRAAGAALLTVSFVAASGAARADASEQVVPVPGGPGVIPESADLGDPLAGKTRVPGPPPGAARRIPLPGPPVSEPIGRPVPLRAPLAAPGAAALAGGTAALSGGLPLPAANVMSLMAVLGAGGLPAGRPDTPSVSPAVPDRDVSRPGMPPVSAAPKDPGAKASHGRPPAGGEKRDESATALPSAGIMKGEHRDPTRIAPSLPSAQESAQEASGAGSWSSSTMFGLAISALLGIGAVIMMITRRIRLRGR